MWSASSCLHTQLLHYTVTTYSLQDAIITMTSPPPPLSTPSPCAEKQENNTYIYVIALESTFELHLTFFSFSFLRGLGRFLCSSFFFLCRFFVNFKDSGLKIYTYYMKFILIPEDRFLACCVGQQLFTNCLAIHTCSCTVLGSNAAFFTCIILII